MVGSGAAEVASSAASPAASVPSDGALNAATSPISTAGGPNGASFCMARSPATRSKHTSSQQRAGGVVEHGASGACNHHAFRPAWCNRRVSRHARARRHGPPIIPHVSPLSSQAASTASHSVAT